MPLPTERRGGGSKEDRGGESMFGTRKARVEQSVNALIIKTGLESHTS